jgi:hypothetical protein
MACKLKCPNCGKVLKEEGDEMKLSQGEYRVYDSIWNSKCENGTHRLILCLFCGHTGKVDTFDDYREESKIITANENLYKKRIKKAEKYRTKVILKRIEV